MSDSLKNSLLSGISGAVSTGFKGLTGFFSNGIKVVRSLANDIISSKINKTNTSSDKDEIGARAQENETAVRISDNTRNLLNNTAQSLKNFITLVFSLLNLTGTKSVSKASAPQSIDNKTVRNYVEKDEINEDKLVHEKDNSKAPTNTLNVYQENINNRREVYSEKNSSNNQLAYNQLTSNHPEVLER